MWID
jgi:hypothetical protein